MSAAAERIRASLDIDPDSAEAWSNLALVLEAVGRQAAAVNALKEAVRRDPRAADVAANLAALLLAQGELADAEAAARHATTADPQYPHGWYNLALALERQERVLEALDAVEPRSRAGAARDRVFRAESAARSRPSPRPRARAPRSRPRWRANPTSAPLRFEYASLLENEGEPEAAAQAYAQAVRLDPSHGPALSQLIFLKRWLADWRDLDALEQQFREGVAKGRALLSPFVLLGQPSTRDEQRRCADAWSAALAGSPLRVRRPLSKGKLRVGYLSADFHTHATAFLAAGLFEQHDRARFETVAVFDGSR